MNVMDTSPFIQTTMGTSPGFHTRRSTPGWNLTIVYHPNRALIGSSIELSGRMSVTLGRASDLFGNGALNDRLLSRTHAVLEVDSRGVLLVDNQSTNGTRVNDAPVTRTKLRTGDRIRIGSILLLFHDALPAPWQRLHPELVGVSSSISKVLESVHQVSRHNTAVLIQGETGTGKELVARAVHRESGRRGDFVTVNCGAITDNLLQSELFGHNKGAFSGAHQTRMGLFGAANGGTLFLDEIGEASPRLQVALLRVLETSSIRRVGDNEGRPVNVRIVAATNRDLKEMIAQDGFRADLYARLSGWTIQVDPLSERKEDIIHLSQHFIRKAGADAQLSRSLINSLLSYDWPYNIRQLRTAINWTLIESGGKPVLRMTPRIEELLRSNSRALRTQPPQPTPVIHPGDIELKSTLLQHSGNIKAVSADLGVSRSTLYRWLKASNINVDDFRVVTEKQSGTTVRSFSEPIQ